jgi:hypothetical protein
MTFSPLVDRSVDLVVDRRPHLTSWNDSARGKKLEERGESRVSLAIVRVYVTLYR